MNPTLQVKLLRVLQWRAEVLIFNRDGTADGLQ
jgi:hypothetical protein